MRRKNEMLRADELFFYREKILEGFSMACMGFLQSGKYLLMVKQKRIWKIDGAHVKRFEHWVKNELGISKSTAYNTIAVYEKYGDVLESTPRYQRIDFSYLVALLPYTKDNATVQEKEKLLDMIEGQTGQGVKNQLRVLKGLTPTDECPHLETKLVRICTHCSRWMEE